MALACATISGSGRPKNVPEADRYLFSTASFTSSTIWPRMLDLTAANGLGVPEVSNALTGYGQSVIGRIRPSFKYFSRGPCSPLPSRCGADAVSHEHHARVLRLVGPPSALVVLDRLILSAAQESRGTAGCVDVPGSAGRLAGLLQPRIAQSYWSTSCSTKP